MTPRLRRRGEGSNHRRSPAVGFAMLALVLSGTVGILVLSGSGSLAVEPAQSARVDIRRGAGGDAAAERSLGHGDRQRAWPDGLPGDTA